MNREQHLEAVKERKEPWDVIVIGGGATGAGCALDAASRGLSVLLLEQKDFGSGTSSKSTKLVHGGVRYLEQGQVSLVREALKERGRLKVNAAADVTAIEFIVPCYSLWQRFYYTVGLKTYDILSGKLSFGKSKSLSRSETIESLPNIKQEGLRGGVRYFDGRFDDTKLLLSILRTADAHDASVLNYAPVTGISKNKEGRIDGVLFECSETGEVFKPKAKSVINATGAFTDEIRRFSDESSKSLLSCSQGVHLVFDDEFLDSKSSLMIPKTSDGRVLFAIPFYGKAMVGTTDTPIPEATLEPRATADEIDFILENCAVYFEKSPTRDDIRSVFVGIRPLVADGDSRNTANLSRGHSIDIATSGMVTIAGGKWTTYRNMAEDAVDIAIKTAGLKESASITGKLKLIPIGEFDTVGLDDVLSEEFAWTVADVVRSVRFEMARTVQDVLARRTRILFLDTAEALRLAPFVAEIMASELGKDKEWIESQISEFEEYSQNYQIQKAS